MTVAKLIEALQFIPNKDLEVVEYYRATGGDPSVILEATRCEIAVKPVFDREKNKEVDKRFVQIVYK
jgi:hypothetical protein